MPLTPFHFGAGALLHSAAPARISFLAFCAANVVVDMEPGYYLLRQEEPWHRFFHTFVGVSLTIAVTITLILLALRLAQRHRLPNPFQWQSLTLMPIVIGAILGGYSHILLDAIKHADVHPFAPWTTDNPFLHAVSLDTLHLLCLGAGGQGILIIVLRKRRGAA